MVLGYQESPGLHLRWQGTERSVFNKRCWPYLQNLPKLIYVNRRIFVPPELLSEFLHVAVSVRVERRRVSVGEVEPGNYKRVDFISCTYGRVLESDPS